MIAGCAELWSAYPASHSIEHEECWVHGGVFSRTAIECTEKDQKLAEICIGCGYSKFPDVKLHLIQFCRFSFKLFYLQNETIKLVSIQSAKLLIQTIENKCKVRKTACTLSKQLQNYKLWIILFGNYKL